MKYTLLVVSMLCMVGCGKVTQDRPIAGPQGSPGVSGAPGSPGIGCEVSSVSGSAAPNGGSLITCPTSSALVLNGAPGAAGTVITSKQLCPGTPSYPSAFIEVAFCIDDEIYGVYSANGGFMTWFPAGTYMSNGINASCNLTIGAHCTVSN